MFPQQNTMRPRPPRTFHQELSVEAAVAGTLSHLQAHLEERATRNASAPWLAEALEYTASWPLRLLQQLLPEAGVCRDWFWHIVFRAHVRLTFVEAVARRCQAEGPPLPHEPGVTMSNTRLPSSPGFSPPSNLPSQASGWHLWEQRLRYFVYERAGLIFTDSLFDLVVDFPDRYCSSGRPGVAGVLWSIESCRLGSCVHRKMDGALCMSQTIPMPLVNTALDPNLPHCCPRRPSLPTLHDLRACLENTSLLSHVAQCFAAATKKRLLHPGGGACLFR